MISIDRLRLPALKRGFLRGSPGVIGEVFANGLPLCEECDAADYSAFGRRVHVAEFQTLSIPWPKEREVLEYHRGPLHAAIGG